MDDKKLVDQYLHYCFYDFAYSKIDENNSNHIILYFNGNEKIEEERINKKYEYGYKGRDLAFIMSWTDGCPIIKPNPQKDPIDFLNSYSDVNVKYKVVKFHLDYDNDHFEFLVKVEGVRFSKLREKAQKCNTLLIKEIQNLDKLFSASLDNMLIGAVHRKYDLLQSELTRFFESFQNDIKRYIAEPNEENLVKLAEIFNSGRRIINEWFKKFGDDFICHYYDDNVFYVIARYLEAGEKEEK